MLAGSTAVALAAHAECPVVVVRGRPAGEAVVVGVDASPGSDAAIGFGFEEAAARSVPVVAVLAWQEFLVDSVFAREPVGWQVTTGEGQWHLLAQRMAGWQQKYPDVTVVQMVVRDRPAHTLLDMAGNAQLLVVGSRGHGGFSGMLLGSTSQALVYHSPCPVAVVRPR